MARTMTQPAAAPADPAAFARPCPVCGGTAGAVLHDQAFTLPDGHPLAGGYSVVDCARCGFAFADTAVTQAEYDAYYAGLSRYEDPTSTGGGEQDWDARRLDELAAFLLARLRPGGRILDVGCANGGLLARLADPAAAGAPAARSAVVGLDPSPACVRRTAATPGVACHEGSLLAVPDGLGRFDGVVLSHVLEHVSDLAAAARAIRDLLNPGGWVYAEVPDATRYAERLVAPFQEFNTEHINHFSPAGLDRLMLTHGLARTDWGRRDLPTGHAVPYPAHWGLFAGEPAAAPRILRRDDGLGPALAEYVGRSAGMLAGIAARLEALRARDEPVVVWGVGELTRKLLRETALGGTRIAAFVDANPIHHGTSLIGVGVLPPSGLAGLSHPVLVASTIHQAEITRVIREDLHAVNELVLLRE